MKPLLLLIFIISLLSCEEKVEDTTFSTSNTNTNDSIDISTKMLYSIEFTSQPVDSIKTLSRSSYHIYSNASSYQDLCSSKSLLSDVAYKEVWKIDDKNDPMLNISRVSIEQMNAQEVLKLICENKDAGVISMADLDKFGMKYKEFTAFFPSN